MAYTEPGVIVRRELENEAGITLSAPQDPVIVGELYEVFVEQEAASYSALAGAGAQVITWPGRKATSIIDLAGVRTDTAEPDDQLLAAAVFPLSVILQDPETLTKVTLDPVTDIEAVGQAGFSIIEGVAGAVARATGTTGTAAENGKIRSAAGGFVAAGVKVGDRVRVRLANTTPSATILLGTVSSVTDNEIGYTHSGAAINDDPVLTPVDVDLLTTPGKISSAAGGFTAGISDGDRIGVWTEAAQVNTGNGTVANTVTAVGLALTAADVGKLVTIGSARPADTAVTAADGVTNGTNTLTGTGITSAHVGRVVKVSGGTGSIPATYRRVVSAGVGTLVFSGAVIPASTGATFLVYAPVTREISTVVTATEFTYLGTSLADGVQTDLPVITRTLVLRDVTDVDSNTLATYSGAAITSTTGFLLLTPVQVFAADTQFQVFPNYDVLVSFRALDTTLSAGLRVVTESDITALVTGDPVLCRQVIPGGEWHPVNPLAFAAIKTLAAMGTDDRELLLVGVNPWSHQVTATGLPGDRSDVLAYAVAGESLSSDDRVFYQAPLTRNASVRDAFVADAVALSAPEEKQERTVVLSYALPLGRVESNTGVVEPGLDGGNKKILDAGKSFISTHAVTPGTQVVIVSPTSLAGTYLTDADSNNDELVLQGANWTLTPEFTVTNGDFDAVAGRVSSATANAFEDTDIGDWIVSGGQYRRVSAKINNQTLAYTGAALTGTGATVSVIRSEPVVYHVAPLSKSQQATTLKGIGQSRANERVVHVWPDLFETQVDTNDDGSPVLGFVSSVFAAAVVAGQLAVVPPERSTTGLSLPGFSGLSHSNRYFTKSDLNVIAEGGWTIFHQPTAGGSVKCRHLLSTNMSSIKKQEFAFLKNVDNQAKVIRVTLEPALNDENGRRNISQALLDKLMLPLQAIMDDFVGKNQLVAGADGSAPYEIVSITQHPTLADRIVIRVRGNIPIAGNVVDITYVI